jgi:hypothetical protein
MVDVGAFMVTPVHQQVEPCAATHALARGDRLAGLPRHAAADTKRAPSCADAAQASAPGDAQGTARGMRAAAWRSPLG